MTSWPRPRWPAVVFDLDGTLVDSVALIVQSYQHALRSVLGREVPEAQIRGWIGQTLVDTCRQISPRHADALENSYRAWNLEHTPRLLRPYAGVDRLLADLAGAGVRRAVATSKRSAPAHLGLRLCHLEGLVDTVVAFEDTAAHKPGGAPLLLAARRLGVPAHHAGYVGDAVVDLRAARAAGMPFVGVLWGAGTRQALEQHGPDELVDTVAQLSRVLLGEPPDQPARP